MLTRRLDLKLLAAVGGVCLLLLAASLAVPLFLSYLHFNVSDVLSENVRSTDAAARLEATTKDLVRLLRFDRADPLVHVERVREQNQAARELLADSERLANLDTERSLVGQVSDGLQRYLDAWDKRPSDPAQGRAYDAGLADRLESDVLPPCIELRKYNMRQIEESDAANRAIVNTLKWGMLAVGLGGSLGGLVLGYAVARNLRQSIGQLSVRIRDAAGRLSRDIGSVTVKEEGDLPDLHQQMQHVLEEIEKTIEQLQQREREVLRAEQLAAVGQIAAGVAHELRNPLTAIKMLVQTGLEGDPPPGLPAEDLSVIETSIRRMEAYIRTFLDFARPPKSERRRGDLLDVVRRASALVEGRARRQRVTLDLRLPPEPVPVSLDPQQVEQVLVNLLLNALDAMPRGGDLAVEVDAQADAVQVRVRDSGPGLPPGVRARLFEPFVTGKEGGVGLGLSICKRLVEAHGGSITAGDAPGGGTVVAFLLPLDVPADLALAR